MLKIGMLAVAASLALSTTALAGDAKKHELATAKADAKKEADAKKQAALEKAREKAHDKTEALLEKQKKPVDDTAKTASLQAEKETHARNVGEIERLQQIADATSNADLKTAVQRLSDKETKRHQLATGA